MLLLCFLINKHIFEENQYYSLFENIFQWKLVSCKNQYIDGLANQLTDFNMIYFLLKGVSQQTLITAISFQSSVKKHIPPKCLNTAKIQTLEK